MFSESYFFVLIISSSLFVPISLAVRTLLAMKTHVVLPILRRRITNHPTETRIMLAWATYNREALSGHRIVATGTTGALLEAELNISVLRVLSGALGRDQQIGARISEGDIDVLIFFWDPWEPHPHDPDVKALLRIAVVWNIPIACNRSSADFLISSSLMPSEYERRVPDYDGYHHRLARHDVA
jgi:methylglyoxal synthase